MAFSSFGTRALAPLALAATVFSTAASAQDIHQYEVTITNITRAQTFTPQLVVTHDLGTPLFALATEASLGLEVLAEGGDTSELTDEVASITTEAVTMGGLLAPGASTTVSISGDPMADQISIAAMLIPTNDTFVGLTGAFLPQSGTRTYTAVAYDAGTEVNDQDCANMPGPRCGGEGFNEANGEGYIYISNGFHELPNDGVAEVLGPLTYDWRNPVALVTVTKVN